MFGAWIETGCGHVSMSDSFDFLDATEFIFVQQLEEKTRYSRRISPMKNKKQKTLSNSAIISLSNLKLSKPSVFVSD